MAKTIPSIMRRPRPYQTRGLTNSAITRGGMSLVMPSVAGITVTPQVALTFTAVFAAINVISRDFASLPPDVYQTTGRGKEVYSGHAAQGLLNREPDPFEPRSTALRFRQSLMGHALGWGNGFAEIVRDGGGSPTALKLLHPGTTKPMETTSGRLYYDVQDEHVGPRKLLPENVFHLAGLGFDGVTGYSPVSLAREAVGLGKAAEQFGSSLFGNGAIPKGILKTPRRVSETATRNLRESVYNRHQGSNNGNNLMILEEGWDWVNTQINPDDAQFLATRAFQILEIARIYSVPPHKIGDYSQSHLANVEESNLDYLTTTLAGWLGAFEAEGNLKLISEEEAARGIYIAHDMTGLLRGNMTARIAYYTGMRNLGCFSADDILERENFNPIGPARGGDKLLVQLNLTTLEQAGATPEPKPVPGPTPTPDPTAPDVDPPAPKEVEAAA